MPEFDVLMSPAVSQLTNDPLVELNGITYVVEAIHRCKFIHMHVCMYICADNVFSSPDVTSVSTFIVFVHYRATSIYVTQALVRNRTNLTNLDVMLVGTNDGKIMKIVMTYNGTDHIPLISEELSVRFLILSVWVCVDTVCVVFFS